MYYPFKLKNSLNPHANNDLDDSLNAKKALSNLGYYRIPAHGLSPYPDRAMFGGIKDFQRKNSLEVDGIVKPNGPTAFKMSKQLAASGGFDHNLDEAEIIPPPVKQKDIQGKCPDGYQESQEAFCIPGTKICWMITRCMPNPQGGGKRG